ncbi:hypothetical protein [Aestuariivivens sediminis]|uniref:hypothetical protein n=1 Tax=Aestuariivivens sediminis TaxID=2913557 RepID=UPI001F59C3BA|nr:hypothetical protein [Aestuariivivens sediminis]
MHFFKWIILPFAILSILLISCKSETKTAEVPEIQQGNKIDRDRKNTVDVITRSMEFQIVDTLKSGWNTFVYNNLSNETHFFIFEKLPEGIRLENYKNELVPPFEFAFEQFLEGNIESGMKALEQIPKWFYDVELYGGVGLVSPKHTARSTLFLDPGYYAMECYIRMPNGKAHAFMGMLKEIVVLKESTAHKEPESDVDITISTLEGISFHDEITQGHHTIKVFFKDQQQYETLLGHDVNLVRLENLSLTDSLNSWINAADINQFRTPAPHGVTFLGGVNDLSAGKTGYFSADFSPGLYAFISEVPQSKAKGMLKTFIVD